MLQVARLAPMLLGEARDLVQAFLESRIAFTRVPAIVEDTLAQHEGCSSPTLDDILEADTWARVAAGRLISS